MDLICFSHLRWGFVFQRPNHLMSRFARDWRTFFIEEPRASADGSPYMEVRQAAPQLFVCTPIVPEGIADDALVPAQRQLLDRLIEERRIVPDVLWFYTPMALEFTRHLSAPVIVYDCMDELSSFDQAPTGLAELERELFSRAQLVFTGGHALYRAKREHHEHVYAFPSSVDAEHFASARSASTEPGDQAPVPRPRIGFFGVIDERLDYALLARIADLRPEWQLMMIGPIAKIDAESLPRRSNIHWLGQKQYDELPGYLAGWDVAIMPFALNRATRFISPTKTLEYLAAGVPVVSTAIADVVEPYGREGIVAIADEDSFVDAIERLLAGVSVEQRRAADAMVARTSWDRTWARMRALIQGASTTRPTTVMKGHANV
jgi:glycosyltransferase involved in cell wall biosynthesis